MKISGELLDDNSFEEFVLYLKYLKGQEIPIILVYGGGVLITKEYKQNTGKTREKGKDGLNITSHDLIKNGVIPVYELIQSKLEKIFGKDNINLFSKKNIICQQLESLGEAGVVEKFSKEFFYNKINIIPFVGTGYKDKNTLNINADDIVKKLLSDFSGKVSNLIFLTGTGGVLDNEGKVVSFLTIEKVKIILEGKGKNITFDRGMKKN